MTDHLPECWCSNCTHPHVCGDCRDCMCDELRACEQRVLAGDERWIKASTEANHRIAYRLGHDAALDAAREAVMQALGPMDCEDPDQYLTALAAIDALRTKP